MVNLISNADIIYGMMEITAKTKTVYVIPELYTQ